MNHHAQFIQAAALGGLLIDEVMADRLAGVRVDGDLFGSARQVMAGDPVRRYLSSRGLPVRNSDTLRFEPDAGKRNKWAMTMAMQGGSHERARR